MGCAGLQLRDAVQHLATVAGVHTRICVGTRLHLHTRQSASQPWPSPTELLISFTESSLVAGAGDQERGVSWLSSAGSSGPRGESDSPLSARGAHHPSVSRAATLKQS